MQRLIDFSLKNRLLVLFLGIMTMAGGYLSYKQLPIDAFPDVSPVLVQVFSETEGLAPEEVEKYVTYPVEVSMNGLPNLKSIRSVSNFGLSVVNIYFQDGTDIYFARQLVNERLQEAKEQIPEGFGDPAMGPIATGMGLILFYYLEDESGQYSLEELRSIQDWLIKFHLQTVPGVTEVLGIGGWEKQYQVVVDPNALLRHDISLQDVISKLHDNNLNVGAEFIERNAEELIVRSVGLASTMTDLENIILKANDGTPTYLKQVAEVRIGGAIRRGLQTMNGTTEVIAGMVVKLYGMNSSTVIGDVEEKLGEINKILPKGIKIVPYYEQKTLVEAAVKTVSDALIEGIILVIIILVVFLGAFRPSLVVALAIPFSVLFAMIGMRFFNISANLMSFGGLAIAIGMMVDGSVVLVENVDRLLRKSSEDEPAIHVIARACMQVARPILFAIMIIIIVFLPLFTLEGVAGKTFKPLAHTITLAMSGSLVFTLLLVPALSSLLMRRPKKKQGTDTQVDKEHDVWIMSFLLKLYRPTITLFVKFKYMAVIMALLLLILGVMIYPRLGSEFTPTLQEGTIAMRLTMAPSTSLNESKRLTQTVERRLMEIPEIIRVVTRIGRGEVGAHADPVNNAEMIVLLEPKEQWRTARTQEELASVIRKELGNVPGVLTSMSQPIQMTVDELLEGVRAELAIKLFGDDLDVLIEKAEAIAAVVRRVPGAADVQVAQITGTPQLLIEVDRYAIARYGINISDVQEVVRAAVGGETAGQIFEGIKRFDILVRFDEQYRNDQSSISRILIEGPGGIKVPLSELAVIKETTGPRQLTRENNQRFITVQCNVVDRDIGSFVAEAQKSLDEDLVLPPGYLVKWGGQFTLQQEANKRLCVVIPVTLLIILVLLFSNFNSLRNSLLILLNIPLALVGGIIGLWLADLNMSVPASVGFIALFGIALLNGIVLVTYINQLCREGLPVEDACIKGATLRLRPVLMTALAAALGMIPLLFSTGIGSEVQRPLATTVVGGLITSTILTLLVIPAIYKWFAIDTEDITQLD